VQGEQGSSKSLYGADATSDWHFGSGLKRLHSFEGSFLRNGIPYWFGASGFMIEMYRWRNKRILGAVWCLTPPIYSSLIR
jgi:hypothetical protein